MTKRTMLFVLMTVVGMVSMLTFSIYAWAIPTTDFPTSLWQDSLTGGQITVTSVIGNYNTSWNYVVSNVSYNPLGEGLEYFQLPPLPPGITVTGENVPSGWIMTQQNPPTWQTAPGSPTAGIPPGTQGVFSIQTSGSPGVKGKTGLAGAPQVASFTGELLGPVQATASSTSRATLNISVWHRICHAGWIPYPKPRIRRRATLPWRRNHNLAPTETPRLRVPLVTHSCWDQNERWPLETT